MSDIDGFYRYAGTEVRWDRDGISVVRTGSSVHAPWHRVTGAHRAGEAGGFVQVQVSGRRPDGRPGADRFAFPVRSDLDAQRVLTQFTWHARRDQPTTDAPSGWRDRLRSLTRWGDAPGR